MVKWYFIVDGDPQVGLEADENGVPIVRKVKQNMGDRITKCKYPIRFVLCPGDLTENGFDGKGMGCGFLKVPWWRNGDHDQLGIFLDDYLNNIESKGIKVYCCPGNHDTYVKWPYWKKPVFNFLKRKYGGSNSADQRSAKKGWYTFDKMGVKFISLGIYPDAKCLEWLKGQLADLFKGTPLVFFYHYNTVVGEKWSDWWTDEEKEAFYQVIKDYNVLLIANGHIHSTAKGMWHDIPVVHGSGEKSCIIEMDGDSLTDIHLENI